MRVEFARSLIVVCALGTVMCSEKTPPPSTAPPGEQPPTSSPAAQAAKAPDSQAPGATLPPPHEAATEFQDRLNEYLETRGRVERALPKLVETKDPKKIEERSALIAAGIQEARKGAVQGNIFTPKVSAEFRKILAADAASRTAKEKANIMDEVPSKPPVVNARYPTDSPQGPAALASFPTKLLLVLPELPETIEYRYLGQSLVLRDVAANLIVDYLPAVAPGRNGGGF